MNGGELVNNYITKVQDLVNQMKALGEDIPKQRIVEKILKSVGEIKKFEMVATSIEVSKDLTIMKVDKLSGLLLSVKLKRKNTEESLEHAFSTNARIKNNNFIGRG